MVASNLDDVFHIVFISTDTSPTKNERVGTPELSPPPMKKKSNSSFNVRFLSVAMKTMWNTSSKLNATNRFFFEEFEH